MNKLMKNAAVFLLVFALVCALAACGETTGETTQQPTVTEVTETKEITVETPPPSPTPSETPAPSVPPVAVTTVPMPMPSVSPTPGVTTTDAATTTAAPEASPIVSASPSPSASPTASVAPVYSADAAFASTILPDGALVPDSAVAGYVAGNDVIFRAGPSASARALATLQYGTYVDIVGTENGWTEVILNGVYGYINSNYIARGYYYTQSPSSFIGSSGSTVIIVPNGETHNAVVAAPTETNFLGIMPD